MSGRLLVIGFVCAAGLAGAMACASFTSDEAAVDAGASGDASAEASAAADATSARGFCADAGIHDLCEDFDEHALADDGFAAGTQRNYKTATAGIESTKFVSPPNAFGVELQSLSATVDATFFVRKTLPKPSLKSTRLAFDFYVDALDRDGGVADGRVAQIGHLDGKYRVQINVAKAPDESLVLNLAEAGFAGDGGSFYAAHTYSFANPFAARVWHRLVLTLDYAQKKLALVMDDYPGTTPSAPAFALPASNAGGSFLDLGAQTDKLSAELRFYVDDVIVDIAP